MDDHFYPTLTMSTDPTPLQATPSVVTNGTTVGSYSMSARFPTGPHAWRLARKNGELILQGLMWWRDDKGGGQYWETIPTIDLTNEESES